VPIDEEQERRITIGEATDLLSQLFGVRLAYHTVYSWYRSGIRMAKLDCVRNGRTLFTTRKAVIWFVRQVLESDDGGYGCFHRLGVRRRAEVASALEEFVAGLEC